MKEDNVNNMRFWNEYVDDLLIQFPSYSREELENMIFERMKNGVKTILETIPKEYHLDGATALMGWDIIFDSELNPWLMEINNRPDMRAYLSDLSATKIQLVSAALELLFLQNMNEEMPEEFYGWKRV